MLILVIAVSIVFPTIGAQKIFYQNTKQKELLQLYAENIFWMNLYGYSSQFNEVEVISSSFTQIPYIIVNKYGEKEQSFRNLMSLCLKFNGAIYDVNIVYDNRE
ncbi:MAG: hypothetical protein H0Z24_05260 [Thermosipho sp. (in: Bacteria)]|nr:hypothetical protein [Thermosipho sp. (in: thermotogales)]